MITLRATDVVYFSVKDEEAFFAWLRNIKCVADFNGVGPNLAIRVQPPADTDLRELIALFFRYNIDRRQLAQFLNPQNASWFRDTTAYWHAAVFE